MTIRTRLTLWYSSLLATVILVFAISLFSILNWAWHSQLSDDMHGAAQKVIDQSVPIASGRLSLKGLNMPVYTYPYGIVVRDDDNQPINGVTPGEDIAEALFDSAARTSKDAITREGYVNDHHFLSMTFPIRDERGTPLGTIQVISGLWLIDTTVNRLLWLMVTVGAVALLLSFVMGSIIAKRALQPVESIANTARHITAADDLSKRIPYDGPNDELGQLTSTFNATLGRLERLFNAQRRFVADVSHELRTPLTTIQGNLDLMKRYGNDPESLEAVDSEVKRMTRMVGDLLLLAQADAGRLLLKETTVELATLALDVYRATQVLAKDINFRLGTINAVNVRGDPDRLRQLLINLVSNAIKYTPAGGEVVISVTEKDGYALMSVSDTGIGIPKVDLDHIFDRFYRVDKARARAMGGTGLGLSIATWIAEAHHGRILADSEVGKGSTFTIQLPSLDSPAPAASVRDTRTRIPVPALLRRQREESRNASSAAGRSTNGSASETPSTLNSSDNSTPTGEDQDAAHVV